MAVATVQAQDIKHRRHGKHHQGMDMQKLNLTDDQKGKLKSIHEDFRNQMTELKKNDNITVKEWKTRMENLRNDHKTKMQGLLTNDQKAQVEKMKTERKAMHETNAKARMEKMKIKLGLNDDQVAKMKTNRTEMAEKMKAIRENKSLDEAKKKEQMKDLMKKNKEKMKSILTEEQLKKLQERKEQKHPKKEVI